MAGKTVKNNSLGMILLKGRTFIALIILVIFFSFCAPNFTTANSIVLMLRHTSLYGLLALGMTLVIITGGIDLSVGSVVGLVGMLMGGMLNEGLRLPFMSGTLYPNVPLILLIVAVVAILIGLVSGLLIAYLNVPAFIATLGTMYVCRGFAMLRNGGATFPNLLGSEELGNLGFPTIGSGSITVFGLDIPYAILIFVVLALLSLFILKFTSLGNQIYAVGGNEKATQLSGINTNKIYFIAYANMGLLAGLCGLLNAARVGSVNGNTGTSFEMDAIGACFIGGASAYGGSGTIGGVVIGALLLGVINMGMSIMGIGDSWQYVVKGGVLLVAVIFDVVTSRKSGKG